MVHSWSFPPAPTPAGCAQKQGMRYSMVSRHGGVLAGVQGGKGQGSPCGGGWKLKRPPGLREAERQRWLGKRECIPSGAGAAHGRTAAQGRFWASSHNSVAHHGSWRLKCHCWISPITLINGDALTTPVYEVESRLPKQPSMSSPPEPESLALFGQRFSADLME